MNINIYTDGACSGNPGRGGYGFVAVMENNKTELFRSSEGFILTTNNRMEILAAAKALLFAAEWIEKNEFVKVEINEINVYSDSQLVVNTINKEWATKTNTDLWEMLFDAISALTGRCAAVRFIKVKGHSEDKWNNLADRLAVQAYGRDLELKCDKKYEASTRPAAEPQEVIPVKIILHSVDNAAKRKVEVVLSDASRVFIEPCYGGFQQTGCTQAQAALTVDIAWRLVAWLNGGEL